jgi:hypothetical protein
MRKFIWALGFAFITIVPVAAQDWIGPSPMDLGWQHSNQIGLMVQQQVLFNQQFPQEEKASPAPPAQKPKAAPAASAAALRYTPSLPQRRKNFAQFVAKSRTVDPAGAAQLEQLLAQQDVIAAMAPELAKYGLRVDNVADAYTAWWINAWLGWAGRTDDAPQNQITAVKAQVARVLSSTPLFVDATDAQKQEMSEALLIQGAMIGAAIEQLKTNPALKPHMRGAMAQAGKSMGLDFAAMALGDTGFVGVGAPKTKPAARTVPAPSRKKL